MRRAKMSERLGGDGLRAVNALEAERTPGDDRQRLRNLPVVGGPLGGAIPGTRPGVSRKLGGWSGR